MVSTLALFPLKSVVFPNQILPLHIFESKYLQLILDCETTGITFGIPVYIDNQLKFGTEVELSSVVESYASGEKDIICKGLKVFKINNYLKKKEGKGYAHGKVEFFKNKEDGDQPQREQFLALLVELYQHLEVPPPKDEAENIHSFTYAHKMGLSLIQEYTLLQLPSENKRLAFLINHLCITIPIIQEMNRTKQMIELNGHFRNFDPLDFEDVQVWN